MAKSTKKGNMYFTQETGDAIIRYNNETDEEVRNQIYNEFIKAPLNKLVENIIHTFKFYRFDGSYAQVKSEVVSFLTMNLYRVSEGKGKAFSYLSVVAKNYLIAYNNKRHKKQITHDELESIHNDEKYSEEPPVDSKEYRDDEFIDLMVEYWENNLNTVFTKQRDIMVADAVLELFRRRDYIENFHKKSLYILIREMTGVKTQYITKVVKTMKYHYALLLNEYNTDGSINTRCTYTIDV